MTLTLNNSQHLEMETHKMHQDTKFYKEDRREVVKKSGKLQFQMENFGTDSARP